MAGRQKVPDKVLLESIHRWKGNVLATADAVGMNPKNLRERLMRLGVSLDAVREATASGPNVPVRIGTTGALEPTKSTGAPEQKSSTGVYPASVLRPKFSAMSNAAPVEVVPSEVQARKPIRIHPDHQEQLRQLKLDYAGKKRVETDETAIIFAILAWAIPKFRAEQFGEDE